MRHQIIILAAFGVALSSSAASGKEHSEDECLRLQPSIASPVEMATCTSDLKGSERTLNDTLNELLTHIPTEYRAQLEKSQHTWTDYRNELCLWEAGGYPGSTGHSSAVIACTADMNRERAKYLHDDLKDRW